ncbi:MAG TPA: hypothetical protein VM597_02705 [Gemmataceae bacterium]|jgi:hypothetical protein|nr:hypothetical protein [Gemmataceae bacterium]
MMSSTTFTARIASHCDQIAACVRDHEAQKHEGNPCVASRAAAQAHLAHALGVPMDDIATQMMALTFRLALSVGEKMPLKDDE